MTAEAGAKTCTQKGCDEAVAVRVFWPGESPPPEYCIEHAAAAVNIAKGLGFVVHCAPIVFAEDLRTLVQQYPRADDVEGS